MKCPEGMIEKIGYKATRSSTGKSYFVKSTCVRDVGKPGKTPVSQRITVTDELDMAQYGYTNLNDMKADARHTALKNTIIGVMKSNKSSEHDVAVKVMRRLNYLSILNRNTQVTLSKILERDRNWVGREYLGKDYASM